MSTNLYQNTLKCAPQDVYSAANPTENMGVPQLVIGILIIAAAAAIGFYGTQVAREGWAQVHPPKPSATARPYVIFAASRLHLPTDAADPVRVNYEIKNTGQVQGEGVLKDFTYTLSVDPKQREFAYQHAEPMRFKLAPGESLEGHFTPTFTMTPEKLQALNHGTARLFFFMRGEYRDDAGTVYPLSFAAIYNPTISGLLAIPPDDVTVK